MNKLADVLIFIGGAAVGSIATWQIVKKKYEKDAQNEIESIREYYRQKSCKSSTCSFAHPEHSENEDNDIPTSDDEDQTNLSDQPNIFEYASHLKDYDYSNYSNKKEEKESDSEAPYVITPDEFGERENYEKVSLIYYSDKILADENGEIIDGDDLDETVGSESLHHFGEYEDDSVFVRNDRMKCDYEILMDFDTYQEAMATNPYCH